MTLEDLVRLALVLIVIGGASVVKGAIGFGFPLIAVPAVANILDARSAVILLSLATLFSNFGMVAQGGGSRAAFVRLAPTIVGLVVGTVGGALLLVQIDATRLGVLVGLCAAIFAATGTLKPDLAVPPALERYLALPLGLAAGLLGGSTSIFSPLLSSYLFALRLDKREFIFFISVLFTVGGVVQVASFARLGLYDLRLLLIFVATIVPTMLGLRLGIYLQDRIDPLLFRRLVLALVFLSSLNLILRGLLG